jgi:hypothetical protein
MEPITHTIELLSGYKDKKSVFHHRVVFGHRLTGLDLFNADEHPQGQLTTSYNALLQRAAIVEFGALPLPVQVDALLDLDSLDRDDLVEAFNIFQELSADGKHGELLTKENACTLAFGFKTLLQKGKEDAGAAISYTRVQFGNRITGNDEIEADRLGLQVGIKRSCFLIGKQISRIGTADRTAEIDGPISLEYFERLDAADIATLRGAAELWRQSFRFRRRDVSTNGAGQSSDGPGAEARVERTADSGATVGAN